MTTVNVHEAKTHLSRLLIRASKGEHIVIARSGVPVAILGPVTAAREPRRPGLLKGHVRIAKDFDAQLPEAVLADFFEGPIEPV